ncbi:MAG: RusA family crossover junction endodeoxyribonuclease [Ruminococcus sp.]|nr:RusA family crossover junction endodeoxyribonuclease [Ruminococcus sp.]
MKAEFTIPGEPKGKGRPRFSKRGGFVQTYTPKETKSYEELVAGEYIRQCGNIKSDCNACIHMEIAAYFCVPKSTSKANRLKMLMHLLFPLKKPDLDNIVKIIADALNGIAYHDDKQIIRIFAEKFYSDMPCVRVKITSIGQEN